MTIQAMNFFAEYIREKKMIFNLSLSDFKNHYAGSIFGITWAFINPLFTIAVFWFVFEIGLRQQMVDDVPFLLWFICALIPWNFFAESLSSCTNVLYEYNYLVKKVVFKVSLLPAIKIFSGLFIHLFFLGIIAFTAILYTQSFSLYYFQSLYYLVALFSLVLALGLTTSAMAVFFPDLKNMIALSLQLLFWGTPIFWSLERLSPKLQIIFKLNPLYYITQGYRDSFIYDVGFWMRPKLTLYFWTLILVMLFFSQLIFRKLRPHFADVL